MSAGRTMELYGGDGPFLARAQPGAPQGIRVHNAYVKQDPIGERHREAQQKKQTIPSKYHVRGADASDLTDIHEYEPVFIEGTDIQSKTQHRQSRSVSKDATISVTATLNDLGLATESKHETLQRIKYAGLSGTSAEKNLIGFNDRRMVPVWNGGIAPYLNVSGDVIQSRDFLVFDIPEDTREAMRINSKIGFRPGVNPHRITPFLKPYNPHDQVTNSRFLTDSICGRKTKRGRVSYEEASNNRNPKRSKQYSTYSANRFADYIAICSYVFYKAMKVAHNANTDNAEEIYSTLYTTLNEDNLNDLDMLKNTTIWGGKHTKKVHASMSAAMRILNPSHGSVDKLLGSSFNTVNVNPGNMNALSQFIRYFQDKDKPIDGLLAAIKDGTAMTTKNIAMIALGPGASGRQIPGLLLQ